MPHSSHALSRRQALRLVGSVPMLPIASSLAAAGFTAEALAAEGPNGANVKYSFGAMAAPSLATPAQMATTYVASTLNKRVGRGPGVSYTLGYETFFLTGAEVPRTGGDRKSTRLNSSHTDISRMPSSA